MIMHEFSPHAMTMQVEQVSPLVVCDDVVVVGAIALLALFFPSSFLQ